MPVVNGWAGRVQVLSGSQKVNLPAVRWQVVTTAELVDVTHVADFQTGANPPAAAPLKSYFYGYADVEASVDCLWDKSLQPFSGLFLLAGITVQADLFVDRSDAKARFSLNLILETVTVEEEVRNVCKFSLTGKQSGYKGGAGSAAAQSPGFSSN